MININDARLWILANLGSIAVVNRREKGWESEDPRYKDPAKDRVRDDRQNPDWSRFIKRGRARLLESGSRLESFLARSLQPLLNVSKSPKYVKHVEAWDLINEPEGAIGSGSDVRGRNLGALLAAGIQMIKQTGFTATVGFRTAKPLGLDDGLNQDHIKDIAKDIEELTVAMKPVIGQQWFLPQFHYYPEYRTQTRLPSTRQLRVPSPIALGEFATKLQLPLSGWPEIPNGRDSVTERLSVAAKSGFKWAFPWSATDGIDQSLWNDTIQQQIRGFTRP
jgi:hypothetical protein